MKKLVKEIAAKCKIVLCPAQFSGVLEAEEVDEFQLQLFAEMIVKACINEMEVSKKCDPYTGQLFVDDYNNAIDDQIEMLRDRFGVE